MKVKMVDGENVIAGECKTNQSCSMEIKGKWNIVHRESLVIELANG